MGVSLVLPEKNGSHKFFPLPSSVTVIGRPRTITESVSSAQNLLLQDGVTEDVVEEQLDKVGRPRFG